MTYHRVALRETSVIFPSNVVPKPSDGDYLQRQLKCHVSHIANRYNVCHPFRLPEIEEVQDDACCLAMHHRIIPLTKSWSPNFSVPLPLMAMRR